MEEEFLEYIKEELKYIVTESSKERVETAKLRLAEEYGEKMLLLCASIYLIKGIVSHKEVLVEIAKKSLLCK